MTPIQKLELIQLISWGYRKQTVLKAVKCCIATMDTPISIHRFDLGPTAANEHFLHTIQRTSRQFKIDHILENFSPDDRASGQAGLWLRDGVNGISKGVWSQRIRVWDGLDNRPFRADNIVVGSWIISALSPDAEKPTLRIVRNSQASRPFAPKERIVAPPGRRPT